MDQPIEATIGTQKYKVTVAWRGGTFVMDEPKSAAGLGIGPDPITTLLSALAGCTLTTLRMYVDRKGWDIPEITMQLNMHTVQDPVFTTFIERNILYSPEVTLEQRQKMDLIAKKCPVSKILENKIVISQRD